MFAFFFNDTATTEIYTLSLHDALPISAAAAARDLPRLPSARGRLPLGGRRAGARRGTALPRYSREPVPGGAAPRRRERAEARAGGDGPDCDRDRPDRTRHPRRPADRHLRIGRAHV